MIAIYIANSLSENLNKEKNSKGVTCSPFKQECLQNILSSIQAHIFTPPCTFLKYTIQKAVVSINIQQKSMTGELQNLNSFKTL